MRIPKGVCEMHGKEIISGVIVCLVDHFRADVLSGRISVEDMILGDPHATDKRELVFPVIIQDNYKGNNNLVYTMFPANDKGRITSISGRVLDRDDVNALLEF